MRVLGAAALALAVTAPCSLATETARQILDRAKSLNDTTRKWTDRQQKMRLAIKGRGAERVRELEVSERKYGDDEQKSLVLFLAPSDVKGTAFLSVTHKGKPADQRLYLPELNRVRQITSNFRDDSFQGTDLSYHDLDLLAEMPAWTEDDARSRLRGEETIDGVPCHVIELIPQRDDIGYARIVTWIAKSDLVARQLEFYTDAEKPAKVLRQREVRNVGVIPVPHRIEVDTPAKSSKTAIEVSDVRFDQHLPDDLFTQRALERGGR